MKGFIVSLAVLIGLSSVTMAQHKSKADPKAARKVEEKQLNRNTSPPKVSRSGVMAVWGIGPDSPFGRIYQWTGASWSEPSPTARLGQVHSCKYSSQIAWGIGANQRIFETTDGGVTWIEPNPAAKANQITGCGNWAIGDSYRVFMSVNNGLSWIEPNPQMKLKQIDEGRYDNVWGVTPDGRILKYVAPNWLEPNLAARATQISAMWVEGAWAIGANNRVFVTPDGSSWSEPNPSAGLYQISASDASTAWGIGAGNRIFKTANGGVSWSEPNPQAHLKQVSAQ